MGLMPVDGGTIVLGCNADDVEDPDFPDNTKEANRQDRQLLLKRNGTSRSANTCRNSQEMLSSPLTVEAALIRDRDDFILGEPEDARTSSIWPASNLLVSLPVRRRH